MMKRIGLAKLLALAMTLVMVFSAVSPALACDISQTTIYYYRTAAESAYASYDVAAGTGTSTTVKHTLKSAPTRNGYTFTGFNVYVGSKTGTLIKSNAAPGTSVSIPLTRTSTGKSWPTIHVVAQWRSNCVTYDVIFKTVLVDGKGGQIGKTGSTLGYADIEYLNKQPDTTFPAIPVTDPDPGYVFLGWYTYNGATYTKVTSFPTKIDKDYTFYARWEAKPYVERSVYTLHYIGKPSDTTGVVWPADVEKQASPVTTLGVASKVGATFNGWKLNGTGANRTTLAASDYTKSTAAPVITYDAATDSFIRTTEYIANVHGAFVALEDVIEKYFSVTYKIDLNGDGDYADAGETTLAFVDAPVMPTAVNADVSVPGYTFAGWYKNGSAPKLTTLAFSNYDLDASRTQTIPAGPGTAKRIKNYYSITLVGTLTKKTCQKNLYNVTYTGDKAGATTWPNDVANATSAPSLAADATKNGYTFNGWKIGGSSVGSINWSASYVTVASREYYDPALGKFVTETTRSVTVVGTFTKCADIEQKYYTVVYKIDLNLDGVAEEVAMPGYTVNNVTPMPTGVAGAPSGIPAGYSFIGWSESAPLAQSDFSFVSEETVPSGTPGVGAVRKVYYKLAVTGTLNKLTCQTTLYNVTYTGDKAGATTWPNDVANATSAPSLAADATRNGYTFSGWKIGGSPIGSINWNASYVTVTSREYYDVSLGKFVTETTRSVTVVGTFTKCADIEKEYYTVVYRIDLNRDGVDEIVNMMGYSVSEVETMPTGVAGSPIIPNGYTFGGWDKDAPLAKGDFTVERQGTTPSTQPGVGAVHSVYYTLTIKGTLDKQTLAKTVYTVLYTGEKAGATTWPSDVVDAETPPTLAADATKNGYTFNGWKINGNSAGSLNWSAGYVVSTTDAEYYDAGLKKFVTVTHKTITVTGAFTKCEDVEEKYFSVTYKIDLNGDGDYADENETVNAYVEASPMPTAVSAELALDGYTFAGWFKQGTDTKLTALAFTDYTFDRTVTVPGGVGTPKTIKNYYVITLTGTLSKQTLAKTDYSVTYTGDKAGATFWPADVVRAASAPSIAADATKNGYTFSGWSPASLDWNAGYVDVQTDSEYYDASLKKFVTVTHKTITVTGAFVKCEDVEEKYFSVTYEIDLNGDGDYADAGETDPAYVETFPMPASVRPDVSKDGYTFHGWYKKGTSEKLSALAFANYDYVRTVTVPAGAGTPQITKHYYAVTLRGSLVKRVCQQTYYSVSYTGDKEGAATWPNDVVNAASAPSLAADATKNGFDFTGWKINGSPVSSLNWYASYVTVTSLPEEYDPESGMFITKIHRSITVEGRFVKCPDIEQAFYSVIYKIDLNLDGVAEEVNMLGYTVTNVTKMPTGVAGSPDIPAGYSFNGWDQAPPLELGDFSVTSEGTTPSTLPGVGAIHTVHYLCSIKGAMTKNELNVDVYTARYNVRNDTAATVGTYDAEQTGSAPLSAQALPSVTKGYSIHGWYVQLDESNTPYGGGDALPWGFASVSVDEKLEKHGSAWYWVTYHYYALGLSAVVSENEHGRAEEYNLSYSIAGGPYTDPTSGAALSASGIPGDVFASPTMPALGGNPSMKGHSFQGWMQGGAAIGSSADIDWTQTTRQDYDEANDRIIDVTIYTAAVSGGFTMNQGERTSYNLAYSFANEPYQTPDGLNLTIGNRPADVNGASTPPALAGAPSAQGHTFTGWTQNGAAVSDATLAWGSAAVSYEYDADNDRFVRVSTYSAAVVGDFTRNTGEETLYNLTYTIDGEPYTDPEGRTLSIGNLPANVNDSTTRPGLAGAPTLDGHSFSGWKQAGNPVDDASLDFGTPGVGYRYDEAGDRYVMVYNYSAAVSGSFTLNEIVEKEIWNLTYTGDKDLADPGTWPDDLTNQASEPALTGLTPAKRGYTFGGWKQGGASVTDIAWSATLSYALGAGNRFVKTTTYEAAIEGRLTMKGGVDEYVYIVDYTVHGGSNDYSHLDVNVTNPPALPTIEPEPSESGKVFGGWNPGSLDWDGTPAVPGEPRFDETLDKWVTPYTKKIDVTGSFGEVGHVYVYELSFTGPSGATLPGMKSGTSVQTIEGETASLDGQRFTGWSPSSIGESDYTENESRKTVSGDGLTVTHYMEASTQAQFVPTEGREHYTLHYEIVGSVPGQPANPPDETGTSPITPSAPVSLEGYNFSGWSTPAWGVVNVTSEIVDGVDVSTTWYEATVIGSFTDMQIVEDIRYSLLYQGYVSGVTNWPGDVIDSTIPPALSGSPYLSGYQFNGWAPGTLDWSKASASVGTQVVTPEGGAPYILRTTTYTLIVTASFSGYYPPPTSYPTYGPVPTPTKPPLGTPQTGNTGLIIFFAVFSLITVIFTASLFIRKKMRAIEEED